MNIPAIELLELQQVNLENNLSDPNLTPADAAVLAGVAVYGISVAVESHHPRLADGFERLARRYEGMAAMGQVAIFPPQMAAPEAPHSIAS